MKKIILTMAFFLFFNPFIARADMDDARSDLNSAKRYISDAESYAREAYSTPVLEEAQFNARKAETAAANAQRAIQSAMTNLDL